MPGSVETAIVYIVDYGGKDFEESSPDRSLNYLILSTVIDNIKKNGIQD